MRRLLFRASFALVVLSVLALIAGRIWLGRQGLPVEAARRGDTVVTADPFGVPTLRGSSWLEVIEAQGFAVAAERFFQMDLSRRYGSGRLAALLGPAPLPIDRARHREGWPKVVAQAAADLPPEERAYCDAYAAGVNRFLADARGRWSLEYALLRVEPEPWSCADTMAVLLSMCEQLSSSSAGDAAEGAWREALGPEWGALLFTADHPWNVPLFGAPGAPAPLPFEQALPAAPLGPEEGARSSIAAAPRVAGSNAWAYCGRQGCFLANDPHLGHTVPQVWFALRLERSERERVVGLALPGIPGVALGMNPHLAWAFTNVGEDVDDLLLETLSEDGRRYRRGDGWAPIETVTTTIAVKGAAPEVVVARFTHRGPLEDRPGLGPTSRQWLPLLPRTLRLPIEISRATDFESLNRAFDQMKAPAQNVLMLDRLGNIGYRASGTGPIRGADGRVPQPAEAGEWRGLEPASSRRRRLIATSTAAPRWLVTANQRIWVSPYGHSWADDARAERIGRRLAQSDAWTREDMVALQLDTESRFHRELLAWIAARATPASEGERLALQRWSAWDGAAIGDERSFAEALDAERALESILIERLRRRLPEAVRGTPYPHRLKRAWILRVLAEPDGVRLFGLEERALAARLLAIAAARPPEPRHSQTNRWAAQHPFADRVPVLGRWWAISTPPQPGSRHVPRVEDPKFGASVRVVWTPAAPADSVWSFPVGQSGHPGSAHYDDAREAWFRGEARPVDRAR